MTVVLRRIEWTRTPLSTGPHASCAPDVTVVRHHVAVPTYSFNRDPRTTYIGGSRLSRRELAKHSEGLFAVLGPVEDVRWAMVGAGLRPKVIAVTDFRLLVFSATDPALAVPQQLWAPYRLTPPTPALLGRAVTVYDSRGSKVELVLTAADHDHLIKIAGHAEHPSPPPAPPAPSTPSAEPLVPETDAAPVSGLGWQWSRPVLNWQDAEQMAADHMRYLGFEGVLVTPPGPDGGLDVVARTGAAQVKFHAVPSSAPQVQQLRGAADPFPARLFYATGYTAAALAAADTLVVAAFQFTTGGDVIAVNAASRQLLITQAPPPPAPTRGRFGQLTREARQYRALEWVRQIQDAAQTPISDRRRKGAKQLASRAQALDLVVKGLAQLEDTENPLYKEGRRDRKMLEVETTLKRAANLLGLKLR